MEERRVVFVDDFVAGEMFTAESDSFVERCTPDVERLARDGEHQINVDVVEARPPESVEGFENHLAAVNAAETIEELFVQRLDAHGDTVDPVIAPELRLIQGNRGRIALDGPLRGTEEI